MRTVPGPERLVSGKRGGEQSGRRTELSIVENLQLKNGSGETVYKVSYGCQDTCLQAYLWQSTRSETDKKERVLRRSSSLKSDSLSGSLGRRRFAERSSDS